MTGELLCFRQCLSDRLSSFESMNTLPKEVDLVRMFFREGESLGEGCKIEKTSSYQKAWERRVGYWGYHVGRPDLVLTVNGDRVLVECKCFRSGKSLSKEPNNGCEIRNGILQLLEYSLVYEISNFAMVVFSLLEADEVSIARLFVEEGRSLMQRVYGSGVSGELFWLNLKTKQMI